MTHYQKLFDSKYLKAGDLDGKDVTLTIARTGKETLKNQKGDDEKRAIMYFEECATKARQSGDTEKRLILKPSCAAIIASFYGKDYEQWSGKRITLYSSPEHHFGKPMDVIRVRPIAPPAATQTPAAAPAK